MTWIEARKHCEMKQSAVLALESEAKAIRLSNLIETISQRHFNEFWTSGNDIDVEGSWRWAGQEEGASANAGASSAQTLAHEMRRVRVFQKLVQNARKSLTVRRH